jgi:tetratricopeptide (TPR) repeat protein
VSAGWSRAQLDEIPRAGARRIPVRQHFEIDAFGVNAFVGDEAGSRVIPEHDETPRGHEELYVVLNGRATFVIGGNEIPAAAGTLVYISDPTLVRTAFADEPGTTVLAVGAAPGQAFTPSAWELWHANVQPTLDAGDDEHAIELAHQLLVAHPNEANILFNLACCESRTGRRNAALDHLGQALKLRPTWGYRVREATDLDAIRDDPRFPG